MPTAVSSVSLCAILITRAQRLGTSKPSSQNPKHNHWKESSCTTNVLRGQVLLDGNS